MFSQLYKRVYSRSVCHKSEYTPHISSIFFLYLLKGQFHTNEKGLYNYNRQITTSISAKIAHAGIIAKVAGNKSETPNWELSSCVQSFNIWCEHHCYPTQPEPSWAWNSPGLHKLLLEYSSISPWWLHGAGGCLTPGAPPLSAWGCPTGAQ